jgi:hypothetical protein
VQRPGHRCCSGRVRRHVLGDRQPDQVLGAARLVVGGQVVVGLLCSRSKGKKPVVWACAPGKTPWACLHVIRRHGGRAQEVVVLEVAVPRSWLKRHGSAGKGLWYSVRDVTPWHIRRIITFGELSRSPVEEPAPAA